MRVIPGQYNEGIFITVNSRDNEEYRLTHPAAHLSGFLRGTVIEMILLIDWLILVRFTLRHGIRYCYCDVCKDEDESYLAIYGRKLAWKDSEQSRGGDL